MNDPELQDTDLPGENSPGDGDDRTLPSDPARSPLDRGASTTEFTQLATPAQATRRNLVPPPAPQPTPLPAPPSQRQPMPRPIPPAAAPAPVRPVAHRQPPRRIRMDWRWMLLGAVAIVGSIFLSIFVLLLVPLISQGINGHVPTTPLAATPSAEPTSPPTSTPGVAAWNGHTRFTLLLMGLDKRPGDTGTAFRTDSMILASIDPVSRTIGMLSIPRDLYVTMPQDPVVGSYGLQRVNSAYTIGELVKPGYGPQLAMETVQYNLGIRVDSYVVYDFTSVISAIDAVGGVDIDVPAAINDPAYPNMYYGYDPLHIPAGHIHMDGALALKYARTRHDSDDLDRARRQQQVIMAVRTKVLNLNMLPPLINQAPQLWHQFGDGVRTGLSLDQVASLALYVKDIPKENIHQGVIDWSYVTSVAWNGADVLIPERARIGGLLSQIFGSNYNRN